MGSPTDSGRPRSGRFSDKCKEISPMPSPEASISRCRVRYPSSHILSTERSCLGAEANNSGFYETRFQKNCKTVSSPVRFNGRSNSYDSLGQIENDTYSNVLNSLWRAAYQPLEFSLQIPPWLITHIAWWADYMNLTQGLKWRISPTTVLTTDTSLQGWGGHLLSKRVQGRWRCCQQRQQINVLELQAVFNSLKSFLPKVRGQTVLVQTDNTTVLHYINKLGGTKSLKLCS